MSAEQNERFSKRFWASVYVQSTPSNILPDAIREPIVEELSGQDAAVLGLGPEAVGPPAIRCFACGSDEPMATHRCAPSTPYPSGRAVLPEMSKPIPPRYVGVTEHLCTGGQYIYPGCAACQEKARTGVVTQPRLPSESVRPVAPEEPPEECDVCHTAFGPDGEFRRMMVVRDSAPRRPSSRSPLLMEDEWNLAVCEPCHEQFEAWLFRDMSELDTLRPPPPATEPPTERELEP